MDRGMNRRNFLAGMGGLVATAGLGTTPFIFDMGKNLWKMSPTPILTSEYEKLRERLLYGAPWHVVGYEHFQGELVQSFREGLITAKELVHSFEVLETGKDTIWKPFLEEYGREQKGAAWIKIPR
jgi:hypothetical protein